METWYLCPRITEDRTTLPRKAKKAPKRFGYDFLSTQLSKVWKAFLWTIRRLVNNGKRWGPLYDIPGSTASAALSSLMFASDVGEKVDT